MSIQSQHDEFVDYLAKAAQAASTLDEQQMPQHGQSQPETTPQETPPGGIPSGPEVLHIYIVDEPLETAQPDASVVDSTIAPAQQRESGEQETPALGAPVSVLARKRWTWIILAVCLILAAVDGFLYLSPLMLGASVTVTIIPDTQTLSTVMSVPLTTSGQVAPGTLRGRMLSTLTLSQVKTVPTTGIGHEPATPGHGDVTFYNAAPQVQTIPAGTLLTGKDGTQIVTEADAVIPAGTLATNGQVSVPAQAVNVGPAGNIAASDLYGACCRENVFVQNTAAFTGGHNAYSYPMVTVQDIEKAKAALHNSLMQSVQAAFAAELASNEAIITPIPCQEMSYGNAEVGQDATTVTIGVSETCQDVAYDMHTLAELVTQQLQKQAAQHLSTRYALSGAVTTTITKVTAKGTVLLLTVKGTSTFVYQFSLADLQHMALVIADKNNTEATRLLAEQPGVSQVEMNTSGKLPVDAGHIHVLVVEQGM